MKYWLAILISFEIVISYAQNVEIITLKSKIFGNERSLRIYLPPGYKSSNKSYKVLYLNDGIATFHAYNLAHVVDSLIENQVIQPIIIVGIDNGGSVKDSQNPIRDRAMEYLPWTDFAENAFNRIENPKGERYPTFLFDEVMTLVNAKYRIKSGRKNTGLGGASYGALISLYTQIHYPGKVGYLLLESPSLYVHDQRILEEVKSVSNFPRTYIGIGTREGETVEIQQMALRDAERLHSILYTKNKSSIKLLKEEGAGHEFGAFARRFIVALKFLFPD